MSSIIFEKTGNDGRSIFNNLLSSVGLKGSAGNIKSGVSASDDNSGGGILGTIMNAISGLMGGGNENKEEVEEKRKSNTGPSYRRKRAPKARGQT